MSFSSGLFLIFMCCFLGLFYAFKGRSRSIVLLLASYLFYGFHEPVFIPLIAASTLTDFFCAQQIERNRTNRKLWLGASLIVNLGLLGWFKYQLFLEHLFFHSDTLLDFKGFSIEDFIIPIGISFYTFQTLGYTIDVYRGKVKAEKNLLDFFVFISFFPQLIAGPIERFSTLMPQLKTLGKIRWKAIPHEEVLSMILWGLFKKVVIADRIGVIVDELFLHPDQHSALLLFGGGVLFLIQIYMDFSGYTLMARGLAKAIGVELSINWNFPLFQTNTQNFWRNWHITLTQWFRDYVYYPLGGSKKGTVFLLLNILVVFVLSGLWHGANLTFIIWGLLNAFALILEIVLFRKLKIQPFFGWIMVIATQALFFVAFRAQSTNELVEYLSFMTENPIADFRADYVAMDLWWLTHVVNAFLLIGVMVIEWRLFRKTKQNYPSLNWITLGMLLLFILVIAEFGNQPFIYFQF